MSSVKPELNKLRKFAFSAMPATKAISFNGFNPSQCHYVPAFLAFTLQVQANLLHYFDPSRIAANQLMDVTQLVGDPFKSLGEP